MGLKELAPYGGILIALVGVLVYFSRLKPTSDNIARLEDYIRQSDTWRKEHVADTDRRLKEATDSTLRLQDNMSTMAVSISALVATQGAMVSNITRLELQMEKLQGYLLDHRRPTT